MTQENRAESLAGAADRLNEQIARLADAVDARDADRLAMREEMSRLRAIIAEQRTLIERLEAQNRALDERQNRLAEGLDGAIARVERLAVEAV